MWKYYARGPGGSQWYVHCCIIDTIPSVLEPYRSLSEHQSLVDYYLADQIGTGLTVTVPAKAIVFFPSSFTDLNPARIDSVHSDPLVSTSGKE